MFDDAFEEFGLIDPQDDAAVAASTGLSIRTSTTSVQQQQPQQLQSDTSTHLSYTGDYLGNLMAPDETAFQLLKRGLGKPIHTVLDRLFGTEQQPHRGLRPGDLVEIFGPKGTGKTQLLLSLAAQCVLPRRISLSITEPQPISK